MMKIFEFLHRKYSYFVEYSIFSCQSLLRVSAGQVISCRTADLLFCCRRSMIFSL